MSEWSREINATYTNWLARKLYMSYRVPDAVYQYVLCEAADWSSETGWGKITVKCAATSDYFEPDPDNPVVMPDDSEDGLGSGGAYDADPTKFEHHSAFSSLIADVWEAERTRRGLEDNEFMDKSTVEREVGFVRVPVPEEE